MISSHLRNFRWEGSHARCACPICGDSKKKKVKARMYFLPKGDTFVVYCHNCHISWPLANLLKHINSSLLDEYNKEVALDKLVSQKPTVKEKFQLPKPIKIGEKSLLFLKKISQLPIDHPARIYVNERKIPPESHFRLYYTDSYTKWINSIVPEKYKNTSIPDPRIILPFLDKSNNMFGANGRALTDKQIRYQTIMFDPNMPKIFGLDQVKMNQKFHIFEGPIDSLFISNSIAMAGSSIADRNLLDLSNGVFIFDNEPRNKELLDQMESVIEEGNNICIWPAGIKQKDVNEMILAGHTRISIRQIIDNNTFSGLSARMHFIEWKKI